MKKLLTFFLINLISFSVSALTFTNSNKSSTEGKKTTNNVNGWEKVPVPDYVDKETESPWNIFDDFEDGKLRFEYISNSTNISNSPGKEPYKFKKDPDGNTYLEITAKHKWNKCCKGNFYSERAEIHPTDKRAKEKIIWYGFKVRLPKDFIHIDDRVMFSQIKHNFKAMKKSPLLGLRLHEEGKRLDIGGDTGGVAHKSSNKPEKVKYRIQLDYYLTGALKDKTKKWYRKEAKYKYVSGVEPFDATPLGEWTTYKIGIYNTKKDSGFVKVYKDDVLIFDYEGVTFDWKGSYKETTVRVGLYRDSDPSGKGYPPQSIHYDDFTIVSDKKTLDKYLK